MPVDTLNKRVSALGMTLPLPEGSLDAADREHVVWLYVGIAASPPVAVFPRPPLVVVYPDTIEIYAPDGCLRRVLRRPRCATVQRYSRCAAR